MEAIKVCVFYSQRWRLYEVLRDQLLHFQASRIWNVTMPLRAYGLEDPTRSMPYQPSSHLICPPGQTLIQGHTSRPLGLHYGHCLHQILLPLNMPLHFLTHLWPSPDMPWSAHLSLYYWKAIKAHAGSFCMSLSIWCSTISIYMNAM